MNLTMQATVTDSPGRARQPRWMRLLLPVAALVTLIGYWGPWVDHMAAGLVVLGLDLAEYVKFLPAVRNGQVTVWREGFYLPLVAVSLGLSLRAWRAELGYAWPVRLLLLAIAAVAALNLLPPAWTPALLLTPEFRVQTASMLVCLLAAACSPLLALLPGWFVHSLSGLLAIAAMWAPVGGFLRVLPDIRLIYQSPLAPGWGLTVTLLGLAGLLLVSILGIRFQQRQRQAKPQGD